MRSTALAGLATVVLVAAMPALAKGSRSGVYTLAQAEEGARLYVAQCAMCHGARLEGTVETPALAGKFVASWAGRPVAELSDYLARAMPQGAPGRLAPGDSARLVAFILRANGAPAGNTPLPSDPAALGKITFDPPVGER